MGAMGAMGALAVRLWVKLFASPFLLGPAASTPAPA